MKSPARPLVVVGLITAAHYFHHQLTALVVPLLPFMRDGFSLTYTQAGGLVSAFSLSYGIGQLPAGWLADRIGPRWLLLAGISGVALGGILVGLSGTYGMLVLFLVLMGVMGGGYHPSATPLISAAVPPQQRGRAMGLHLMGGSASHLVAPLLGVALATAFGWRGSFLFIATPVFLLGVVVFVLFGRMGLDSRRQESRQEAGKEPRYEPPPDQATVPVGIFIAMTSAVAAITASIVAFIPLFLVDAVGLTEGGAALALAAFFSAGLWAAPLGGMLADRIGAVTVFAAVTAVAGPLIFLLGRVASPAMAVVILVLLGMTLFVRMTVSESYLIGVVPAVRRSTILGIYFFAGMEGSGIITPVLGNLVDHFGFAWAFGAAGGATFIILAALALVHLALAARSKTQISGRNA